MSAIEMVIDPRDRSIGGSTVQRLLPWRRRRMVGPFIFLDRIGPRDLGPGAGVDIDAHPHIGLSTLTYLIEGRMIHRDSTGAVQTIESGAVNWMTAGEGVAHTERSHPDDRPTEHTMHGLQLWVALPTDAEQAPPFFSHHAADDLPRAQRGPHTLRVLAGTGWGSASPVPVSSPLVLAEWLLGDDAPVSVDPTHPERAVLALDHAMSLDDQSVPAGKLAILEAGASPAMRGRGRVIVLGGEPIGPRHIWWNFVHSDRDRIEQAKRDWRAQRFAPVPDDHEPWVPLPS